MFLISTNEIILLNKITLREFTNPSQRIHKRKIKDKNEIKDPNDEALFQVE